MAFTELTVTLFFYLLYQISSKSCMKHVENMARLAFMPHRNELHFFGMHSSTARTGCTFLDVLTVLCGPGFLTSIEPPSCHCFIQ